MLPDGLLETCLRAMYFAPADKPSYALLADMHGPTEGLEAALAVAYAAGRDSALTGDEWRIVAVKPRNGGEVINDRARSEWEAKALLKVARTFDSAARLEHRRTGSTNWERVDA